MMRYRGLVRLPILPVLALVMALAPGVGVVSAGRETATNIFVGTATAPSCAPDNPQYRKSFPVVPVGGPLVEPDGTIIQHYFYGAVGEATGSLPGDFRYEEYGTLYFRGGTLYDNDLTSQQIILDPRRPGDRITIVDTNPDAYTFQFAGAPVQLADLPQGAMRSLGRLIDPETGFVPKGGSLAYGSFTFTNDHGTFTGYATPDFCRFSIEITFDLDRQPTR